MLNLRKIQINKKSNSHRSIRQDALEMDSDFFYFKYVHNLILTVIVGVCVFMSVWAMWS
ncbi:MAG: hypothetical protein P9M03_03260 [Candidatus Theseobacter exili]|nr:hypothetical protein [Candidatus Theseobacter exili]